MIDEYELCRRGCGERPGLVIVEYRKEDRYFGYETISSQAWFHGIKGDATPFKDRIAWVGRNYIELHVNDEGEIRKQLDLLNSLNPKKPLMQNLAWTKLELLTVR